MYTALIKKATQQYCVCVAVLKCTKPGVGSGLILHIILPYSGKLSKNFANFTVLWLFAKVFPAKFEDVLSFGTAKASNL